MDSKQFAIEMAKIIMNPDLVKKITEYVESTPELWSEPGTYGGMCHGVTLDCSFVKGISGNMEPSLMFHISLGGHCDKEKSMYVHTDTGNVSYSDRETKTEEKLKLEDLK